MKKQGIGNRDQGSGELGLEVRSFGSRHKGTVILLLAALAAVAPQIFRGPSCGHDFDFHLVSWFDCLHAWQHGLFYPHWAASANYGAGEPRFVFYPPLTWMAGAALGALLPWIAVPVVLTFLCLAGTGLAARALARLALPESQATLAGCAALFSGYALFTAYERSAFGEMTGGFWMPMVLLLALREKKRKAGAWRRAFDGSATLLALVVAGAWLSNAPVGVMVSYLLAATALTAAAVDRSWAPILRAGLAAALGIGLSAVYLVPAAVEQRWVDIRQATDDPGLRIENSFLFGHHAGLDMEPHDVELLRVSLLAVTMIGVALVGLAISRLRKRAPGPRRWWIPLALVPVLVLVLQLPVSLPVWNLLPKLRFLQFPWRWLVALEAPMAIFFASAVWPRPQARRWVRASAVVVAVGFFAAITAFCALSLYQPCDDEDAVGGMAAIYRAGGGFEGVDEYAPPGSDSSLLANNLPLGCLVQDSAVELGAAPEGTPRQWDASQKSCQATVESPDAWAAPEHLHVQAELPRAGFMILKLRAFPAWEVLVNGQPAQLAPRADGLMAFAVPSGIVDLEAAWKTTPDVVLGRWISAISLVLVAALCALERRFNRVHLS